MKHSVSRVLVLLVALVMVAAACGGDSGSIEVEDARYRLGRADLGAGYLTVTNTTDEAVTLESASAEGVGRIELHESLAADDGTMAMQARPEGFVIGAGETVSLEPGGKHLMIFDPESTDDLTISLDFGTETIQVVAPFDAEASASIDEDAMGDMGDMDMDMDEMDHSNMDDDAMDDDAMGEMDRDDE